MYIHLLQHFCCVERTMPLLRMDSTRYHTKVNVKVNFLDLLDVSSRHLFEEGHSLRLNVCFRTISLDFPRLPARIITVFYREKMDVLY